MNERRNITYYIIMKDEYRNWLVRIMPYVKVSKFTNDVGISQSNLSKFIHGNDSAVSEDKLLKLKTSINEVIQNIG